MSRGVAGGPFNSTKTRPFPRVLQRKAVQQDLLNLIKWAHADVFNRRLIGNGGAAGFGGLLCGHSGTPGTE